MKDLYLWIEKNIERICKFTMILATFFIGLCLGAIIIYECYEPEIVYVDRIVEVPSEPIVEIRYATEEEEKQRDIDEIEALAKTVWGEARGCNNTQRAAVVWCILNRVDSEIEDFPDDIISVVSQINPDGTKQFSGYDASYPVQDDIVELVKDVLDRWTLEKTAVGDVGRILPSDYLYFRSDGHGENVFRQGYKSKTLWDWKWGTPYD